MVTNEKYTKFVTMIKIDKNKPVPTTGRKPKKSKEYLLAIEMESEMKIGDSTLIRNVNPKSVCTFYKRIVEESGGFKRLIYRKLEDGLRFWVIEIDKI